jgi:hypothetical protein
MKKYNINNRFWYKFNALLIVIKNKYHILMCINLNVNVNLNLDYIKIPTSDCCLPGMSITRAQNPRHETIRG